MVCAPNTPMCADALQAIPAARAIIVAINTRLTAPEVAYQLEHSEAKLVLVDSQFVHLFEKARVPVISCNDDGKPDDAYEKFLQQGARFDSENGKLEWQGLEFQRDELATFAISCLLRRCGSVTVRLTLTACRYQRHNFETKRRGDMLSWHLSCRPCQCTRSKISS